MDQKSRDLLDAADKWLMAIEAMTAADEEPRRDGPEQMELDDAEMHLAASIMDWRDAGRPN
jgi:hypothetical protein